MGYKFALVDQCRYIWDMVEDKHTVTMGDLRPVYSDTTQLNSTQLDVETRVELNCGGEVSIATQPGDQLQITRRNH